MPTTTPSTRTLKSWPRRLVVAPLGGVEGQHVGAGGPAGDGLADRAGGLEEGDLRALRRRRVARGEAAVVARDAGAAGEGPGRAGRPVLELARTHHHLLEPRVGDDGRGRLDLEGADVDGAADDAGVALATLVEGGASVLSPASMAGLPGKRAWVNVGPPLSWSGPSRGSTLSRSVGSKPL